MAVKTQGLGFRDPLVGSKRFCKDVQSLRFGAWGSCRFPVEGSESTRSRRWALGSGSKVRSRLLGFRVQV